MGVGRKEDKVLSGSLSELCENQINLPRTFSQHYFQLLILVCMV